MIGPPSFRPRGQKKLAEVKRYEIPVNNKPAFKEFAHKEMLVRVWRNWDTVGDCYLSIDVVRKTKNGQLVKSFQPEHVESAQQCLYQLRAWLREGN